MSSEWVNLNPSPLTESEFANPPRSEQRAVLSGVLGHRGKVPLALSGRCHIRISNGDHEYDTVEENAGTDARHRVESTLVGLNARVVEGSIQSPEATGRTGRLFSFCIAREDGSAGHGGKFDGRTCSAMLYALGIGLGLTSQRFPLKPPVGS
jgi:hypothetical protein